VPKEQRELGVGSACGQLWTLFRKADTLRRDWIIACGWIIASDDFKGLRRAAHGSELRPLTSWPHAESIAVLYCA